MAKRAVRSHARKKKSLAKMSVGKMNKAGQVSLNVSPLTNGYGGMVRG